MKKLKEKIIRLFSIAKLKTNNNDVENESLKSSEDSIRKELQAKLDEIIGLSEDDETLIKTINAHITGLALGYYRYWGKTDGSIGTRDFQILKTARAHGTRITDQVKSKLSGRIAALDYSITEKEKKLINNKDNVSRSKETLNEIKEDENDDDKQFNLFQSWLYVIFGLLMIIADIVVSLNLVVFFGVGNPHDNVGVSDGLLAKVKDGELLLFSLGIAFCTILVKIIYDDYISTKFGFWQKEKSKILKRNQEITAKALSFEYYSKLLIKFIILLGLLVFLYFLAKYRTFFTIQNVDTLNEAAKATGDIYNILLNCFIGISVMIPIISGISLSVGFRILGRRRMMRKAKIQYEEEIKSHEECYDQIFNLKSKREELATFHQEWLDGSKKIGTISELFANNYNQGFREGYSIKFGNDLYILVENYRNEVINIALADKINKNIS